jgi:type VI secretion system secreted protein VgrG
LFDQAFVLKDRETGRLLTHYPYRIKRADGSYEEGVTDDKGNTHLVSTPEAEELILEIAQG